MPFVESDLCTTQVVSVSWNVDSTLLAVEIRQVAKTGNAEMIDTALQLYNRSNNHWYLKMQWIGNSVSFLGFDQEHVNRLFFTDSVTVFRNIDMIWDTVTATYSTDGSVAVIDGRNVCLTPLAVAMIPPPMSKYVVTQRLPVTYVSFLSGCNMSLLVNDITVSWLLVCLSSDRITMHYGNSEGNPSPCPTSACEIDLDMPELRGIRLRAAHAVMLSDNNEIAVVCLGTRIDDCCDFAKSSVLVVITRSSTSTSLWTANVISFEFPIERIFQWEKQCDLIGVAYMRYANDFEVDCINVSNKNHIPSLPIRFNEKCSKSLHVIGSSNDKLLVFGISSSTFSNSLYCGEILIATNVSSLSINIGLDVLLYVTLGAKAELHTASIAGIKSIMNAIESNSIMQEANDTPIFDSFECRPVERGTCVIASPSNSSVVVLMMTRGNLEGIEPRFLLLLLVKNLLREGHYCDCLILLRRQRLDMNILVDHNPEKFIKHSKKFVVEILQRNSEFLSLFISHLEPLNISKSKYPYNELYDIIPEESFDWSFKVNVICETVRSQLVAIMSQLETTDGDDRPIYPLLCTYVKQNPPLLLDALMSVKSHVCKNSTGPVSVSIHSTKAQKYFKYLAFLCTYKDLFETALGECDFSLAKALARQSTDMDPKEYLPLLDRFEKIGGVVDESIPLESSECYCLMRFKVYVHLSKWALAIQWGIECVQQYILRIREGEKQKLEGERSFGRLNESVLNEIMIEIRHICSANSLYTFALSKLRKFYTLLLSAPSPTDSMSKSNLSVSIQKSSEEEGIFIARNLFSKIMCAYGDYCFSQNLFKEACTAFLNCSHDNFETVTQAIRSAKKDGDYDLALAIAGRHAGIRGANQLHSISPQLVCKEIITEYKSMLEQGGSCGESDDYFNSNCVEGSGESQDASSRNRSKEVAQMCLEYFDDVEGAVGILILSRNWIAAATVASKSQRLDILREEVGVAIKHEIKQMMRCMEQRTVKQIKIIATLRTLWEDPAARLKNVSQADPSLLNMLKEYESSGNIDDKESEFGGGMSVYSNISVSSNMSSSSSNSTVSNLSTISLLSSLSNLESPVKSKPDKSFAVTGIDHSLLSRGNQHESSLNQTSETLKQVKRREKRRNKEEGGKDILGVKSEGQQCRELYSIANISVVAASVKEVCDVCILLGTFSDISLASALQCAMDTYTHAMHELVPPIAPLYPLPWLKRRNMEEVRWFQSSQSNADEKMWWFLIVSGLAEWKKKRNTVLSSFE